MSENATLCKVDRACILESLQSLGHSKPSLGHDHSCIYTHDKDGSFRSTPLHVMPSNQVIDLTHLDLSLDSDYAMLTSYYEHNPRLVVLSTSRPACTAGTAVGDILRGLQRDRSHAERAMLFASEVHDGETGFVLAKEIDTPVWNTRQALQFMALPTVSFTPLTRCKYGLISNPTHQSSGIVTNI